MLKTNVTPPHLPTVPLAVGIHKNDDDNASSVVAVGVCCYCLPLYINEAMVSVEASRVLAAISVRREGL